jgi:hypothetical protein
MVMPETPMHFVLRGRVPNDRAPEPKTGDGRTMMRPTISLVLAITVLVCPLTAAPLESGPQTRQAVAEVLRLRFVAINGDVGLAPQKCEFQIEVIEADGKARRPTEFLMVGNMVPGTKLKITKFEYKDGKEAGDGGASELIVTNVGTGESTVLIIGKITNVAQGGKRWRLDRKSNRTIF